MYICAVHGWESLYYPCPQCQSHTVSTDTTNTEPPPSQPGEAERKVEDVMFSVALLWNNDFPVEENAVKWMGQESYDKYVKEYNEQEDKVWFSNTRVEYDSCDCGDGYGCSHGSWPFAIHFGNNDEKCKGEFEDETSLFLVGPNNHFTIGDYTKITMNLFIDLCQMCGIILERKTNTPAP